MGGGKKGVCMYVCVEWRINENDREGEQKKWLGIILIFIVEEQGIKILASKCHDYSHARKAHGFQKRSIQTVPLKASAPNCLSRLKILVWLSEVVTSALPLRHTRSALRQVFPISTSWVIDNLTLTVLIQVIFTVGIAHVHLFSWRIGVTFKVRLWLNP